MSIGSNESSEQPVAKFGPVDVSKEVKIRAREALLTRLKRQPISKIGRWSRDEIYERGPAKVISAHPAVI